MIQAAKRRRTVFVKAAVPCIDEVAEARVSAVRPLKIGDYGFVYTKGSIMAAQGTVTTVLVIHSCQWALTYYLDS